MPFTPFHMGAAMSVKPFADNRFSVVAFGLAQILMDIEPGIRMLRDDDVLHGPTHTFVGATLIAAVTALCAGWLCRAVVGLWNREVHHYRLGWLACPSQPSKRVLWGTALFATYSHILLDSLMHHDLHPFAPLTPLNPLLNLVAHDTVYLVCGAASVIGALGWLAVRKVPIGRGITANDKT